MSTPTDAPYAFNEAGWGRHRATEVHAFLAGPRFSGIMVILVLERFVLAPGIVAMGVRPIATFR
jgi:hypothetical protein